MTSFDFTGPHATYTLIPDRPTKGYVLPCDPNPDWQNYEPISALPKPEPPPAVQRDVPRKLCACGCLARRGMDICSRCRVGGKGRRS